MWNILNTGLVGGLVYFLYLTYNHVCNNCYLFKSKSNSFRPTNNLVKNFYGCCRAVTRILQRQPHTLRVLGLDCEMTSTSVNGGRPIPATLQLANPNGYCAIFQLKVMQKAKKDTILLPYLTDSPKSCSFKLPSENILREILEDKNILKVGVGVIEDATYLLDSYGIICKSCLDLRFLAELAFIEPRGLNYLAQKVLGKEKLDIPKKSKKPWESDELNDALIRYAATDARLGVEIFLKLNEIVIERNYSWLRRLFWDEKTYWKYTIKLWRNKIGKKYYYDYSNWGEERIERRWFKYIQKYVKSLMKNVFVFESALPTTGARISLIGRVCCVCGIPDYGRDFKVKAVVPIDYGVEFDELGVYFVHLCNDCYEDCRNKVDFDLRQELTEECGAPQPDYEDHRLKTAKILAAEILRSGNQHNKSKWNTAAEILMPGNQHKKSEWNMILEHKLHAMFKGLPKEDMHDGSTMEAILAMDCWPESDHGRFVHNYFCLYGSGFDGLEELKWRWCKRFWLKMRPRRLSREWKYFYRNHPGWPRLASEY
ncbi:uncharacterized protein LOC128991071 [Macrosteles quadrilineatus]|uniref:uncharacterized protein LOC128991071 n=1 Tax=Macrosteles quadrilineatus TaxID=74068 RepID=UPI0023E0EDCE|nr:uncharacterized protein LOC128991071 [Macrosteles quadrilineatus]